MSKVRFDFRIMHVAPSPSGKYERFKRRENRGSDRDIRTNPSSAIRDTYASSNATGALRAAYREAEDRVGVKRENDE